MTHRAVRVVGEPRRACDLDVVLRMAPLEIRVVAEPSGRELADRLEHEPAPALRPREQALLGQRLQRIEARPTDRSRRRRVEAPGEDRQAREVPGLVGRQQLVAPLDRGVERHLPIGGIDRPLRQHGEAPVEALEQLDGRERARARGRQLDGERQRVDTCADGAHRGDRVRAHGPSDEQLHGVVERERRDRRTPVRREAATASGSSRAG